MIGPADFVIVAIIFIWFLSDIWVYPRVKAAIARNPLVRMRFYYYGLGFAVTMVIFVVAWWVGHGRPLAILTLTTDQPNRIVTGWIFVAVFFGSLASRRIGMLKSPQRLAAFSRQLRPWEFLYPRSGPEHQVFLLTAVTGGICEEVIFRGFILEVFGVTYGLPVGILASVILYGLSNLKLGWRQAGVYAIFGFALAWTALSFGSLVPVIIIHAAFNVMAADLEIRAVAAEPAMEAAVV